MSTLKDKMESPRRTVTEWVRFCYNEAVEAGWYDGVDPNSPRDQSTKIALIHSEVSEALEGIRKGHKDEHLPDRPAVEVELADAVIRIFDLAGSMGLDIEAAMYEKCTYNRQRNDHKREVRAASGGKKF